mmetsp:Transcript_23203/g.34253  ORF Transcript_23203/g.34253 Transcript_23203/m.34253 type:complete len:437 (-) Transcript_23203:2271-3581(-)
MGSAHISLLLATIVLLTINALVHGDSEHYALRRRLVEHNNVERDLYVHDTTSSLRIAVFGSSNSWGAKLDSRFDAYPYLLSPNVFNYADYAAGPNYPAVCTYSMVGETETFDVIIFEYWLKDFQGLIALSQRLRERFPHAMLLFVKVWSPLTARRQPHQGSSDEMDIFEWKLSKGLARNATYEGVKTMLRQDDGYWYFPNYTIPDQVFAQAEFSNYGFDFAWPKEATMIDTLVDYIGYFEQSHHLHLSKIGHAALAHNLRGIINTHFELHPISIEDGDIKSPWSKRDDCNLWFTTGSCPFQHSTNWVMTEIESLESRYALNVIDEGWIKIANDSGENRKVYISYLATKPQLYPNAEVTLGEADPVILVAITDFERHAVAHHTKTVEVGMVPPGETTLTLKPTQSTLKSFHLLGITLVDPAADMVPLEYEFGTYFVP